MFFLMTFIFVFQNFDTFVQIHDIQRQFLHFLQQQGVHFAQVYALGLHLGGGGATSGR